MFILVHSSFAILTVPHLRNMLEMEGPGPGFLSFRPFVGIKRFGSVWGLPNVDPLTIALQVIRPDRRAIGRRASSTHVSRMPKGRALGRKVGETHRSFFVFSPTFRHGWCARFVFAKVHPVVEIPCGCPGAPVGFEGCFEG